MAVWGHAMVVRGGWCGCFVAADGKYGAKIRQKTSSFSTPNRGGFPPYLLSVFFADVS